MTDQDATTAGDLARRTLARMTLEQRVGQVFMLGFDGLAVDAATRALVHGLHLGGVTLFGRNIASGRQAAELTAQLQSIADPVPLFVAVDQEGGLVVRVTRGATIFPGNMALGATGDPALARRVAAAQARELLAMGINMNLAPVLDVNTNPLNPVIGVRSFGADVSRVCAFGIQTIHGLQATGVSAVAKHFPGHGDTAVDSHRDLPVVAHSLERLRAVELVPFRAAVQAGVDGIMTAHLGLPAVEPRAELPATLSRNVLTGLLREQLSFRGLILTDALDMAAIARDRPAAEAAVEAFAAGADLLLSAGITAAERARLADGPAALLAAVRAGRVDGARLDASVVRVLEAKARRGLLGGPPRAADLAVLDSGEHRRLALEVARRAVTLHRDDAGRLPVQPAQRILVVVPDAPARRDVQDDELPGSLLAAVRQFAPSARGAAPLSTDGAAMDPTLEVDGEVDLIVLGTFDLAQEPFQQALARALVETGKPVIAVSLRGPYDAPAAPGIGTFLTVYGDRPSHLQAAAEALFGQLTPGGQVP